MSPGYKRCVHPFAQHSVSEISAALAHSQPFFGPKRPLQRAVPDVEAALHPSLQLTNNSLNYSDAERVLLLPGPGEDDVQKFVLW